MGNLADLQLTAQVSTSEIAPERQSQAQPLEEGQSQCDLLVLGGGPGGYSAAFRAADLGLSVVLVERYATLGGVCLNVGCIPSKALLHTAAQLEAAQSLASHGVVFEAPTIDLDKLRSHTEQVVGTLTSGLAGMAKARKVRVLQGTGRFTGSHQLTFSPSGEGKPEKVGYKQAIIATGSQPVKLTFLPDDPRIVDSTGALTLPLQPRRMLLIGGGIIGLEMGTIYSALGARLDVVEMADGLMPGADRDIVDVWLKHNRSRFDHIMLSTRAIAAQALPDGIQVSFDGANAPTEPQRYDLVLVAVGRRPNSADLGIEALGLSAGPGGFIEVDEQMRTAASHIFAIGDIVGQPMLAHKAVHQGHVAAEVAAGHKAGFDTRLIASVAYTDPEVAWVGTTETQARESGVEVTTAVFPWAASGRAIANGRNEGLTKLLFDAKTQRVVGGAIVGTQAGDLIAEVALAIEMGADAVDIAKTIHPHPTLSETVGLAAEVALGTCTDLPAPRRRRSAI